MDVKFVYLKRKTEIGVLLTWGSGRPAFARVTLLRERESYPLVSSDAAESAAENGQGKRFGFRFFVLTHEPVNHEP